MKKAKANGIAAIYVACPECGGDCENARGSLLVTPEDTEVSCVSCAQTWEVSARAFGRVGSRAKCDCGIRLSDLKSFFGEDLEGHVTDCKRCGGVDTLHLDKEDQVCLKCGHSSGVDAEGSVYEREAHGKEVKVVYDAEQVWYQGYERMKEF